MVTRVLAQDVAQKAKRRVAATVAPVAPVARKAGRQAQKAARVVQRNVSDAVVGTLGLNGERMSKVDTAWLRMDSASNLMMIVGVWVIRPKLKLADLQQLSLIHI